MKIAICQLNPIVGDLKYNYQKIKDCFLRFKDKGVDLVITSELSLIGYPPRDLLFNHFFIKKIHEYSNKLVELTNNSETGLIFGTISSSKNPFYLYNSLILAYNGEVFKIHNKFLLPEYDVFEEQRYFIEENETDIVEFKGKRIGLTICEDIWNDENFWDKRRYKKNPVRDLAQKGIDLLIDISASPFYALKYKLRYDMIKSICSSYGISVVMVNQVGANDDLIFDGRSMVFNKNSDLIFLGRSFEEDIRVVDVDNDKKIELRDISFEEDVLEAIKLGIRDYLNKLNFKNGVVLGLSGGIDSALVATIATLSMGKDEVWGILMPSKYSSKSSVNDAIKLSDNLGIKYKIVPIKEVYNSFLDTLGYDDSIAITLAEENLQARIRGTILMYYSNKYSKLLLTTGNKSELATGYCTLYGDMNGGLNPIGDLYKTQVYKLADYINREYGNLIPKEIIEKPPSAELRPNQKDQDTLPEYEILDKVLYLYIEKNLDYKEISKELNLDENFVISILNKVDFNEYKRFQATIILKLSEKSLGRGRKFPLVQGFWKNREKN